MQDEGDTGDGGHHIGRSQKPVVPTACVWLCCNLRPDEVATRDSFPVQQYKQRISEMVVLDVSEHFTILRLCTD